MEDSKFRFRLRIAAKKNGKFSFQAPQVSIPISETLTLELAARNADSLDKATNFHIDGGGFETEEIARSHAEALRIRLRLLNAILDLGLHVPIDDKPSGHVSDELKEKLKSEQGSTVIDSIFGVNIYPDDGLHFEYVFGGNIEVRPSDPSYIFDGLKKLWPLKISLDASSETALHILGLATQETSDKAAFLTAYLALEQLIERQPRSDFARTQIQRFQQELAEMSGTNSSALTNQEVQSLSGALAALKEESFSSALTRFGRTITAPEMIKGLKPTKFLSTCIETRNKIAHKAELRTDIPLAELSSGLREVVLGIIWTRNNLPAFSMTMPPSALSIPPGGMEIRAM